MKNEIHAQRAETKEARKQLQIIRGVKEQILLNVMKDMNDGIEIDQDFIDRFKVIASPHLANIMEVVTFDGEEVGYLVVQWQNRMVGVKYFTVAEAEMLDLKVREAIKRYHMSKAN
jgi:hypothetical protein